MATVTQYGDISPRTAAYAVAQLLKRGMPYLVIEKFGQTFPIPSNSTKVAKFRRYFLSGSTGAAGDGNAANAWNVPLAIAPLAEGVTPAGRSIANQDYTVTLQQYGDYATITDVIMDTHEDRVLEQMTEVLGEQAAITIETVRYNVLKAGTNVFWSNGVARSSVNTPLSLDLQRQVTTGLARQNAKMITQVVKSTPDFRTEPVEAGYFALIHPDLETDVRKMSGFIPTKQYGTTTPYENEIGACERVRYLASTVFTPFADAGAAKAGSGATMRSTTGTNSDVYPILVVARDAYGIVPLKGKDSLTPMVVNPKPAPGDPLAQRGTVGWKAYQAAVILNDAWMARVEVAATA
jgi:N4-gp56 family major capsid protein